MDPISILCRTAPKPDTSKSCKVDSSDSDSNKTPPTDSPPSRSMWSSSVVTVSDEDPSLKAPSHPVTEASSHSDTVGVTLPRLRDAVPKPPNMPAAATPPSLNGWLASLAGTAAYSGSFMIGRLAQFALTATGHPDGAGKAFAAIAGGLHLLIEPGIATMRERLGMAADKDTAAFTSYIAACCAYLECKICGDQKGMDAARNAMRAVLSSYGHPCKPVANASEEEQPDLPQASEQFLTMLRAFGRGWTSNEAPFFSFTVFYMLTNPAGLAARAASIQAGGTRVEALAVELMFSLAGGLAGGTATVGLQNLLRPKVQGTGLSTTPTKIRLEMEHKGHRALTHIQLEVFHKALKDAMRAGSSSTPKPDAIDPGTVPASIENILNDVRPDLPAPSLRLLRTELSSALKGLPADVLQELDKDVRTSLNDPNSAPYSLARHLTDKFKLIVASKDSENRFGLDWRKVLQTGGKAAGNLTGLMVYSFHLSHAIQTVAGYGPVNVPVQGNSTEFNSTAYPTSTQDAYGQVTALGASLITCWVVGRAVVPPLVQAAGAVITGVGRLIREGSAYPSDAPLRDVAVVPGMGGVQIV